MTVAGRSLVRVIGNIVHLVLMVAALIFLVSGIRPLFFVGLFLFLFFLDELAHRGEGSVTVPDLLRKKKMNVAAALTPDTFSIIERAFDRSIIAKKDFFLEVASGLLSSPRITKGMGQSEFSPKELKNRMDKLLEETPASDAKKTEDEAERLIMRAFEEAEAGRHAFIGPEDLFAALSDFIGVK